MLPRIDYVACAFRFMLKLALACDVAWIQNKCVENCVLNYWDIHFKIVETRVRVM
jgi:hypothetical protein